MTISIETALLNQAQTLAQQLKISEDQLFELALEHFIRHSQDQTLPTETSVRNVHQGDVYWIQPNESNNSEFGYYPHPYVVIQDDLFNRSRINTVVVCALTSNMRLANEPGNVLLDADEAQLPKQSVVVVSKISTVEKSQLGEYIGSLSKQRVEQILIGIRFQQASFFAR